MVKKKLKEKRKKKKKREKCNRSFQPRVTSINCSSIDLARRELVYCLVTWRSLASSKTRIDFFAIVLHTQADRLNSSKHGKRIVCRRCSVDSFKSKRTMSEHGSTRKSNEPLQRETQSFHCIFFDRPLKMPDRNIFFFIFLPFVLLSPFFQPSPRFFRAHHDFISRTIQSVHGSVLLIAAQNWTQSSMNRVMDDGTFQLDSSSSNYGEGGEIFVLYFSLSLFRSSPDDPRSTI